MQTFKKLLETPFIAAAVFLLALAGAAPAQQPHGMVRGQVTDESGAVIPNAKVTLANFAGVSRTLTTGPDGTFSVTGLVPGRYTLRVFAAGMAMYENTAVDITDNTAALNIELKVSLEKQELTVADQPGATVSTDPASNAGALVLRGT